MPLVAWACLLYAAGLLVAQTASSGTCILAATAALSAAVGAIASSRAVRWRPLAPCAVLFTAGVLVGIAAQRDDRRCAASLAAASAPRATLESDAAPGTVVHAHLASGGCDEPATLLVQQGTARAGESVAVQGELSAGDRGILVRNATLSDARADPSFARARAAVGRRIDRLFGADAPLVRALVIADMSAIPADERDRFARAGLVHMLSVSGLHVAIIALALTLLASALRLPPAPSRIVTLALLGLYVIGIGAPPPAVRAAVMLGLILLTKLVQRPTSVWAILAIGGAVPLADPAVVVDLGWQLSVAGTVALVAGGALAKKIVPHDWPNVGRGLATAATVSVVATLVTAPLVAWTFGRIALLGPVTNLLADPVMGVLQPVLFLALAIPISGVEHLTVDAAHLLILAFDTIAARAADVPHAAPIVLPTVTAAIAGAVASVSLVIACLARRPVPALLAGLAAIAVMTLEPLATVYRSTTELHMIDVGQGDALALRTRRGHWIVIDAGRSWIGGDAGRSTVVPYIAHRGGDVALFVLSHPHADHVGGAASLFAALRPARFLDPGYVGTTPPYLAAIAEARRDAIPWQRVHPGDSLVVDEVVLTALAPDSAWAASLADANLASAVVSVRVGGVRMLFTGDAEGPEEDWLLANSPNALGADILKVGHHGSSTSTTAPFLAAVHPRLALVSVGAHNSYGHPDHEVIAALQAAHAQVLRTDLAGTVVVRTDGATIEVEARGQRWRLP
jgi:competence protein ComEC